MSPDPPGADGTGPLAPDDRAVVERLLSDAWGSRVVVVTAEVVAERAHVVRVVADDGRRAIVKQPRRDGGGRWGVDPLALATEWATLEFLGAMPETTAPRLLGGDTARQLVVLEDLAVDRTLADSLLGADPSTARADLVSYAEALAATHAWSIGRGGGYAVLRAAHGLDGDGPTWWLGALVRQRGRFVEVAADLGADVSGLDGELDRVGHLLDGGAVRGLVHGDPCPDNVVIVDGRCRILDFERSSLGSVVLDAAYLVAPFPSCWCFGPMPADVGSAAMAAYHGVLAHAGVDTGDEWDVTVAAALAAWVVVRGAGVADALAGDEVWGTTGMRPRILTWTDSFLRSVAGAEAFPRLHGVVRQLHDTLQATWPEALTPRYPAFASTPRPAPPRVRPG